MGQGPATHRSLRSSLGGESERRVARLQKQFPAGPDTALKEKIREKLRKPSFSGLSCFSFDFSLSSRVWTPPPIHNHDYKNREEASRNELEKRSRRACKLLSLIPMLLSVLGRDCGPIELRLAMKRAPFPPPRERKQKSG